MLHHCFSDDIQHFRETDFDIFANMHAQCSATAIGKDLEVSSRLRRLHDAERVLRAGHRQVASVVASDLQKDAAVRATFVGLPGRMQETWAEAEAGCDFLRVANGVTNLLQPGLVPL